MPNDDLHDRIDALLHDAEHAAGGAQFATLCGHADAAARLHREARLLLGQAEALDPERAAPAWQETTMDVDGVLGRRALPAPAAADPGAARA